jgi:dihydrolipoamide dehydrogenase
MARKVEVLVIGAGPGGYPAAIRAAQLGKKVLCVESEFIGGTCLNVGCIPSKAVIHASSLYDKIANHGAEMGLIAKEFSADLAKIVAWKQQIVKRLTDGVSGLFQMNKVEKLMGKAVFVSGKAVEVTTAAGKETIEFDDCVIATGSTPIQLPAFPVDGKSVFGSTEALAHTSLPKRVVVLGGGYIGLEIGTFWRKLGAEVTVVELMPQILTGIEQDCAGIVARNLKKRKVRVLLETKAVSMEKKGSQLLVHVEGKSGKEALECDAILSTVGRKPLSQGLGLDKAGVAVDAKGFITIDERQRTSAPRIYAIGDVAGQPMLAHKATYEGILAAEVIAGSKRVRDWKCVPAVVFTDPEIASVGLTEDDAKGKGLEIVVGKFPFTASGRALSLNHTDGFVKIVAEKASQRVLGVHIVGPEASEIIAEGGLAIEMGATLEDLALTIHAHPTLPEAIMEAAEAALGHPIHIFQKK